MASQAHLITADEFLRMPDDGHLYDLVQGRLIKMSHPSARHGLVATRLGVALYQFVEEHELGVTFPNEVGFKLASDPDTVRGPDVAFIRRDRIGPNGLPDAYWLGAPDLAVEVRSKNDRWSEVMKKVGEYLRGGAQLVWVIDPKKQDVVVYRSGAKPVTLTSEEDLDGGHVVPGFRFAVRRLFE